MLCHENLKYSFLFLFVGANGSSLVVFSCPFHSVFLPTDGTRAERGDVEGYSASLATMTAVTSQYYKTDYTILSSSNSSTKVGSGILYACVGGILMLSLLLILVSFVGYYPSKSARTKEEEFSAERVSSSAGDEIDDPKMDVSVHCFPSECRLFEQSMPYVFNRGVTLTNRILYMFTTHHRWIRLTTHGYGNGKNFWSAKNVSNRGIPLHTAISERMILALHIIVFFFFQCLFLFSLDGESTCNNIYDESTCSTIVSASLSGDSICRWNVYPGAANALYGYCTYIQPDRRLNTLIYIALYSALCAVLLSALNQFIIHNVLVSPKWIRKGELPKPETRAVESCQVQSSHAKIYPTQENFIEDAPEEDVDSVASANYTLSYPDAYVETSTYNPNRSILSALSFNPSLSIGECDSYSIARNRSGFSPTASVFQEKSLDEYSLHYMGEIVVQNLVRKIPMYV